MAKTAPAARGFGGTPIGNQSVELTPKAPSPYVLASAPMREDDYFGGDAYLDEPKGLLRHITVERAGKHRSKVGVQVEGGAKFFVKKGAGKTVVLTLYDTGAANLNVRRILDASRLQTSVVRVKPHIVEDNARRVELHIELREPAPVQIEQDEKTLWLHIG